MRRLIDAGTGWLAILRRTGQIWLDHNAFSQAGALAFFTLFSLAPTLIILVTVVGAVLGEGAAEGEIVARLQEAVGMEAAAAIEQAVLMSRVEASGPMPTLLAIGAILIGATSVFGQLRASLNLLWGVRPDPNGSGLWHLAKTRLLALLVVLLIGLSLLLSYVLDLVLRTLALYFDEVLPYADLVWSGGQWLTSALIVALFIAALLKVLPDVVLGWRDVALGALVTTLMLAVGRYGIAALLARTAMASTYGAAASVVIVLFWVYYSSLILLLGAAFTRAHLEGRGRPVTPRPSAVKVVNEYLS